MPSIVLILLILLIPAVCAPLALLLRRPLARKILVGAAACAMIVTAAALGGQVLTHGRITVAVSSCEWVSPLVTVIDAAVIVAILYFGIRLKEWKIIVPSVLQAAAVFWLEGIRRPGEGAYLVNLDNLSLVLTLIVSVMGPLIAVFALGYMDRHEAHRRKGASRQPVFFATIYLFLFAMNAVCLSDNLLHFYAFWEITTLCSFLLIGHDRTRDALKSARLALWLNSVGGLFLAAGIIVITVVTGTVSISGLIARGPATGALAAGVMMLCCAGFVKSAQMPFQAWLLGAMVAPTPVSALLHSSTMVKAGVYLIVRLSPLFGGMLTGHMVCLVGGFTFMAASLIAMGQSNGKRVLAYSTIANLGLIITCAGLGGPVALSAAILLIIFHAVSKGLMFLCVGTVELGIGSRNIEDMFGIYSKMPFTATVMVIGMISMVLPPFGVLITKWMALEAAVRYPAALVLIVLGSAFTIVFWVKWLGAVLTVYHSDKPHIEKIPFSIKLVLGVLGALVPVLTAMISPINNVVVAPAVASLMHRASGVTGDIGGVVIASGQSVTGGFSGVILLLAVMLAGLLVVYFIGKISRPRIIPPYACGEHVAGDCKGREFIGPADKPVHIRMYNYYLPQVLGEDRLTGVCALISSLLILIMFGVS